MGEIPLGDRWVGDLSVKGNSIFVGKDKGIFAGTEKGGRLSVVPKDCWLEIDLDNSAKTKATKSAKLRKGKWPNSRTNAFLKCAPYGVKLVGTIKDVMFPGPPNYKDITKGDEPEDYWILKLHDPINVAKDPGYPVPDGNEPQLNVRDLQLNLDVHLNADYNAYRQFLNKKVVVTGELSQGFTVHHKTAVLVWVQDIQRAE